MPGENWSLLHELWSIIGLLVLTISKRYRLKKKMIRVKKYCLKRTKERVAPVIQINLSGFFFYMFFTDST